MMNKSLNQQFSEHRNDRSDEFNLRLHRALSWFNKAEISQNDLDIQFITLWISFNAIYAREFATERSADRETFNQFIAEICRLDKQKAIYKIIWQRFPQSIRVMLDNHYVFQPFWDFHNGKISEKAWRENFEKANKKAFTALARQDTYDILLVVFDRLYTLRNQLVHGGATYDSQINRLQIKDGCQILLALIPAIIEIVLNNSNNDWGKPFYPVVK
jgi:hypothetical protein